MWVIKDADSTIYLIGTMHLLKHDTEWNAEKVKKTVHESTELWLEIADLDGGDAAVAPLMAKFGMDTERPLSSKLNEEQRKKLEKIAGTYGFPVATLEPMRPWLAALVLAVGPIMKAGYDPKAGVERMLSAQAVAEGDKIRGFETAEEQLQLLAGLSEAEQIAFLTSVLDDLEKGLDLLDKLAKAWIDGDTDTIKRLSVDDMKKEAPTVYQKLIVQRNIAWSEKNRRNAEGFRRPANRGRRRASGRPGQRPGAAREARDQGGAILVPRCVSSRGWRSAPRDLSSAQPLPR